MSPAEKLLNVYNIMKTAIYPGSFDPFTLGHKAIVEKGCAIFDKVVVAIGYNCNKRGMLTPERRKELIERVFDGNDQVEVVIYEGLTTAYCKEHNINIIIRGVRNISDFEMERDVAELNNTLLPSLETIFLMTPPHLGKVSSSAVREILLHGGDPMMLMPEEITIEDLTSLE